MRQLVVTYTHLALDKDVTVLRRVVKDVVVSSFAGFGFSWIIIESFGFFFPERKAEGGSWYAALVIAAILFGLWKSRPKRHIKINLPMSDSTFEIQFGDLFSDGGVVIVPVNEYFDGEVNGHVSENSIHGQFINRILGGRSDVFFSLTETALDVNVGKHVSRPNGRQKSYPIGTIASIDFNATRYLLAALSKTDIQTLKASATVHELWDCLAGIWQGVRDFSDGNPVKLPLLGSGLSGVGLPAKNLIEIMLTSFVYYTKKQKIADKVTLVLHSRLRSEVDLETIRRSWT